MANRKAPILTNEVRLDLFTCSFCLLSAILIPIFSQIPAITTAQAIVFERAISFCLQHLEILSFEPVTVKREQPKQQQQQQKLKKIGPNFVHQTTIIILRKSSNLKVIPKFVSTLVQHFPLFLISFCRVPPSSFSAHLFIFSVQKNNCSWVLQTFFGNDSNVKPAKQTRSLFSGILFT